MSIDSGQVIPLIVIGGSMIAGLVAIFGWIIVSTNRTSEREKSRREIAAYVAEGTISADDAAKLLAENSAACEREKTKRDLASYVAEGYITPDDAEQILAADKPAREKTEAWTCGTRRPRSAGARRTKSAAATEVAGA